MRRLVIFVLLFLLRPGYAIAQANGKLQIHYMDVGQGDAAVLISPLGEVVLFDDGVLNQCGKPIAYLQSLGITKIDYHIASHYHADHIGCAAAVLSMFPLQKAAYDRGGSYASNTFNTYVAAVGSRRVMAQRGQILTLDAGTANPVTITFVALNGNGVSTTDENDLSLVSVVHFGQFDAEFGGDLSGSSSGVGEGDPVDPSAPNPNPPPSPPPPPPTGDICERPQDAPASSTAICNDGTYSSAQHRQGACSSHGGKRCWLCPGLLCSGGGLAAPSEPLLYSAVPVSLPSYADIESSVASLVGKIEVYKVHHHASRFSSNAAWLAITTPKVGIVSIGNANLYGHPTAEALTRLHNAGVKTYWTSVGNGTAPVPGQDVVAGNIEVLAAPGSSTFTVIYQGTTDTYSDWAPPNAPPLGSFDTPTSGAVVSGEVAITGWALDDSGVAGVDIYRSPLAGEPAQANGLVLVGAATQVTGARPDIVAAYPTYPGVQRAGWGYMLLTNMLPNQGNGTFTLSAFIRTLDGANVFLGSKTIVASNASATTPFGTIDTPGQGQSVSGTITNFGWALTPQPNIIPIDGSTISVYVDDVFRGHPTYHNFRSDISLLFPGYANSGGAVAYFSLDTTTLSNGVHTIAWGVVDNAGRSAGIGSRYFTVANGATSTLAETASDTSEPHPGEARGVAVAEPPAMVDASVVTGVSNADSTIPPFGVIESPLDGVSVSGRTVVSGWALDLRDVPVSVDLLVDGVVVSRSQTRGPRPDVCALYPFVSQCETRQPGFAVTWDTTRETTGMHRIAVRVLDPMLGVAVIGEREVIVVR
jgi:beta-lactamase superfamily II metal-dependent hydrolase